MLTKFPWSRQCRRVFTAFLDEMGHFLHPDVERLQPRAQFRFMSCSHTHADPPITAGMSTYHEDSCRHNTAVLRPHGAFP